MADYDAPSGSCNGFLVQLTEADRLRLEPYLEEVSLLANQVLVEPGRPVRRAYFPHDCFVSLEIEFESGPRVEAATIGREGAVGLPLFVTDQSFPARVIVKTPGRAATIAGDRLDEAMAASADLRRLKDRYAHAFVNHALLNVACRPVHSTPERLAKWLLMAADRTRETTMTVTQEHLGTALGVGRPTVSQVAGTLQRQGLIRYRRGNIEIVDRAGLESAACTCYREIRNAYETLLGVPFA